MARILVKAVDYVHQDPDVDNAGCYKRGDVVAVMPDGHVWGNAEGLPKFEQVDLQGKTVEEINYLIRSKEQSLEEITNIALRRNARLFRLVAQTKKREVKARRRFMLDLDNNNIIKDKT